MEADRDEYDDLRACPECEQGKCRNCTGFTWDNAADREDTCPCAAAGHKG